MKTRKIVVVPRHPVNGRGQVLTKTEAKEAPDQSRDK